MTVSACASYFTALLCEALACQFSFNTSYIEISGTLHIRFLEITGMFLLTRFIKTIHLLPP